MRIRLNLRWLLVPALFFSLQLCRANNLTFNFDTNSAPLWDLSGLFSFTLNIQEPNGAVIPVSLAFNMHQDATGHLHGLAGDFQSLQLDENSVFAVTNTIAGQVTGPDIAPTVRFVVHFSGFGGSSGLPQGPISATLLVDATITTNSLGNLGLVPIKPTRFMARLPQASVRGVDSAFTTIPLPPGEDGSWTLNLQFDTFNRAIGSAVVTTPSQSLGFNLSGIFTGTNNIGPSYKLKMIGSRAVANTVSGVGSTATIFLNSTLNPLDTVEVDGRIMGQKLSGNLAPSD